MGYSIEDFVKQLSNLEGLLAEDFRGLSEELHRMENGPEGKNIQFRLVEQLQYHDIIRQKIEHVRELMEELAAESEDDKSAEACFTSDPQLIELSVGLLRYTQMEYQRVTALTQQLIFSSGEASPGIIRRSLFDGEIQRIIKSLENLYLEAGENNESGGEGNSERLQKLLKSFSMKSEREVFSVLFEEENAEENDDDAYEGQVELF